MMIYKQKLKAFTESLNKLNKKFNAVSLLRLGCIILFLILGYIYVQNKALYALIFAILLFIGFIFLLQYHSKLNFQKKIQSALIQINKNEIEYLNRTSIPFDNGEEFNDFHHPYAYDLDFFGAQSVFQNLNRSTTYIGKKTLANQLLNLLPAEAIQKNQIAIQELCSMLDWRQEFSALAKICKDKKSVYVALLKWNNYSSGSISKVYEFISYCSPALILCAFIGYLITFQKVFLSIISLLFVFNLALLGKFLKQIKAEIATAENIDSIIKNYGLLVQKIENEDFNSKKLQDLKNQLKSNNQTASMHIKTLAGLFSMMDSIGNFVTALFFNGLFLFNVHVLKSLLQWKKEHSKVLEQWLNVIGEFEMLNSMANFSFNNPDFVYPKLNTEFKIDFNDLSHPLLDKKIRIVNDVTFHPQSFMILTGSNMSGKSTFLRSLGVNMVLAGTGSVVCATAANIHPMSVLVSMRLSDSLSDSESYFFAEIKRLKLIMDVLNDQTAFVLLDEILRGTNSDDKRNGTIEVVKKVIAKNAIGVIATHDVEVCLTTNDYPTVLTNTCFEVEILKNELHFDYKLRKGICKNKSATFLMKKMEII